ncbi:hypothetical protein F5B20DRAFT_547215 [Whalleya microplaca]|nr:hypothetical protein F5B20DRAFT_547215 [Whalleya microplaca]
MFPSHRRALDDAAASVSGGNTVTDMDRNPMLQMTTWLLIAITSLVLGFHQLTRFYIKIGRPFGWEDSFIIASYVIGLGEFATVLVPQNAIYGKDIGGISGDELRAGLKAAYARDLLFVLCVGLSKLSVYLNLLTLSPSRIHRHMTHALGLFVLVWTITSFLGVAFQCRTHGPWDNDGIQCSDMHSFLNYVAVTNILTDVVLIAIPIAIVFPLHMALNIRLSVIAFYMTRALVILSTICQLIYLPRLFDHNFTLHAFPYDISMQFGVFTSILASCVVYLWPLLQSLQSGFMSANNPEGLHEHPLKSLSKPTLPKSHSGAATLDSRTRDRREYIEITTDIDIHQAGKAEASLPPNVKYNLAWERK